MISNDHLIIHWLFVEYLLLSGFSYSDYWRGCKLCCVRICSSSSRYPSWCIEYHCQVYLLLSSYCMLNFWHFYIKSLLNHISCVLISFFMVCSAVLAQFILNEKLHQLGILGCVMCIAGSVVIVIHAPQEHPITSVQEIYSMATQPG
jgi:hypothetical protein